jgi:hypothetical protein
MVTTDRETADKDDQYMEVAALSGALSWDHPRETEARSAAPRTLG